MLLNQQQPPVYVAPQPQYNPAPAPAPMPTNNVDLESGSGDLNVPKNIKEIKGQVRFEVQILNCSNIVSDLVSHEHHCSRSNLDRWKFLLYNVYACYVWHSPYFYLYTS